MKKTIIFSPGPANISERVRKALTLPDICHRDDEFTNLLNDVKSLITKTLRTDDDFYDVVLFSGSGTLAIESLLTCLAGWKKTILIISNGIYGGRAADIARTFGVKFKELKLEWGTLPNLTEVEKEIKMDEIGGVYLVHHETTTGLLNPLKDISLMAKKYNKLVLVDTISSIAGEDIDFRWGLDGVLGTANKCFRGVPGVSFAIVSKDFVTIAKKRDKCTYYSDLITHLEKEKKGETPFTPPVHSLFAFKEALREISEEGIETRIAHYKNISRLLRAGLKDMEFRLYLPDELYSNTMTSVYLPSGFSYQELHDILKEKGFVIYNAQGSLHGKVFMLGVVGLINERDIKDFLGALSEVIKLR